MAITHYPKQEIAREAWYNFIHGNTMNQPIRPEILRSWIRCRERGTNPYLTEAGHLSPEDLSARLEKNAELLAAGRPAIDFLYQFIAGSGFAVALSDADACFLYVAGDDDAIRESRGNVIAGADWSEAAVGTSSIGTAIHDDTPLQLFGYEHFSKLPQRWAGSGCPVHDTHGKVIGSVSLSGKLENVHLHTLGMVVITARTIEVQMALKEASELTKLTNQYQRTIIDSISEGLLVTDMDNRISIANNMLLHMLKADPDQLLGLEISKLIVDHELIRMFYKKTETTDYITKLVFGNVNLHCTVTCRRIAEADGKEGMVLVVNEIARATKLAQRLQLDEARFTFDDIIGKNIKLLSAVEIAKTASETSANVLILGESGTGKDVFAQAIHNGSARRNGPFVAVNCGAIPRELIASTLFGYEEGAFTGAKRGGNPGKFELADGGTIFLDEIGEIPLDLQSVLLRVLERKPFTRIGGKNNIFTNVRIIAATNRDLALEAQTMRFRLDLYYRLNVLSIQLTPLRERPEDINALCRHFLAQMNIRYNRNIRYISPEAETLLCNYDWPGNIRELQNVMERAVVLTKGDGITADILMPLVDIRKDSDPVFTALAQPLSLAGLNAEKEKAELMRLLELHHWNISKIAIELGVARSTLYRKIDKFHLRD